jgi:cyclohexadieny/prephenate dehydrogenase
MRIQTLTIVGVGLIGGSIALAAKRRDLAGFVIGTGKNQAELERALAIGAIDECSMDCAEAVGRADVAVFCMPVDQIADQVLAAAQACSAKTLLTDTGSTKSVIVKQVEAGLPDSISFVGSHPLAGSEKRGVAFADADLLAGRVTIVTRTPRTAPSALERTIQFWESLGSRTRVMDPEEHDRTLALTSHLPHLVASALAGILPRELQELTATGFRDTTRIAAGDPSLWSAVFRQNQPELLQSLQLFERRLDKFRAALTGDDSEALDALLKDGKEVRDALGS